MDSIQLSSGWYWVIQWTVLPTLCATEAWGPFLESPETFRPHFGSHNSFCVFKAKASRGTKLCTYFTLYPLYNLWKDQLYRISGSQLCEWLAFRDFLETGFRKLKSWQWLHIKSSGVLWRLNSSVWSVMNWRPLFNIYFAGLVNKFLSASYWIPLSRLTYSAYLLHLLVLGTYFGSFQHTTEYTDTLFVSWTNWWQAI